MWRFGELRQLASLKQPNGLVLIELVALGQVVWLYEAASWFWIRSSGHEARPSLLSSLQDAIAAFGALLRAASGLCLLVEPMTLTCSQSLRYRLYELPGEVLVMPLAVSSRGLRQALSAR